mgnify:CR=1 FL=1
MRFLVGGGREDCGCGSTWTTVGVVLLLLLWWTARAFFIVHLYLRLRLLLFALSARPVLLLPLHALLLLALPPSLVFSSRYSTSIRKQVKSMHHDASLLCPTFQTNFLYLTSTRITKYYFYVCFLFFFLLTISF